MVKAETNSEISQADSYYWINVKCSNCGFKGKVGIPKHTTLKMTNCPKCETENLFLDN